MADTAVYIKSLMLSKDLDRGLGISTQLRNGEQVSGEQINATHFQFKDPSDNVWNSASINELLIAILNVVDVPRS